MLFPGDFHADPVIRGGGGLAPKGLGSVGPVQTFTNEESAAVLEAMAHPFHKGGCVAHRSIVVERQVGFRCHKRVAGDEIPGFKEAGEDYMWDQVIWYSCVFLEGLGVIGRDMASVGWIGIRAFPRDPLLSCL